jgi:glycosyltransferase involved in cell wall biosynthesis
MPAFLRANCETYERLVRSCNKASRTGDIEALLNSIRTAARFAGSFHSGRFADGAIENLALEVGVALRHSGTSVSAAYGQRVALGPSQLRRVVHVVSQVGSIGGHTRMLNHWIRNDKTSRHSIVVLNQGARAVLIPPWLAEAVKTSQGLLNVFPHKASQCQKALWLREIAQSSADLVVLHHDSDDVVPTVAFATDGPPVAMVNQSDHQFWLGSSVCDTLISLRTAGAQHATSRRFIRRHAILPIPLDNPAPPPKASARQSLGIPTQQVALLSIGRAQKYRPCGNHDFVATAGKILDRHPSAHLYVVGETTAGIKPYLRHEPHARLHFVGPLDDPSLYRAAADVYIESFPFGSNTALLEAALQGLPVVPAYDPLFNLLVANNDALQDLLHNSVDERELIGCVDRLIVDPQERMRLGAALRERLLLDHVGEGWLRRLAGIYDELKHGLHQPAHIPSAVCDESPVDMRLGQWADGMTNHKLDHGDRRAILLHSAFTAKEVGDFSRARRFALSAVLANPCHGPSWRLLAIATLGSTGKLLARIDRGDWRSLFLRKTADSASQFAGTN